MQTIDAIPDVVLEQLDLETGGRANDGTVPVESGHAVDDAAPAAECPGHPVATDPSPPHIHIPAQVQNDLANRNTALSIVIGRADMDAAVRAGFHVIGLADIWSWMDSETHALGTELAQVPLVGREVNLYCRSGVLRDNDAVNAIYALFTELERHGANVTLKLVERAGVDISLAALVAEQLISDDPNVIGDTRMAVMRLKTLAFEHKVFDQARAWLKETRAPRRVNPRTMTVPNQPPESFQVLNPKALEPETYSQELKVIGFDELMAHQDDKPRWVIDRMVEHGTTLGLVSRPNTGKTFAAISMAIAVAAGRPWLDKYATIQGSVTYFDMEGGQRSIRSRVKAATKTMGLDLKGLPFNLVCADALPLNEAACLRQVRWILTATQPKLVVVDSFTRAFRGAENMSMDVARFFAAVRGLAREFGFTVIITDHLKKQGGATGGADEESIRGSSDKVAALDYILKLDRHKGDVIVKQIKARDSAKLPPFIVGIESLADDEVVMVYRGEATDLETSDAADIVLVLLKDALPADGQITRKDLVTLAKDQDISVKKLDEGLQVLVQLGTITPPTVCRTSGNRGAAHHVYRWAGTSDTTGSNQSSPAETEGDEYMEAENT